MLIIRYSWRPPKSEPCVIFSLRRLFLNRGPILLWCIRGQASSRRYARTCRMAKDCNRRYGDESISEQEQHNNIDRAEENMMHRRMYVQYVDQEHGGVIGHRPCQKSTKYLVRAGINYLDTKYLSICSKALRKVIWFAPLIRQHAEPQQAIPEQQAPRLHDVSRGISHTIYYQSVDGKRPALFFGARFLSGLPDRSYRTPGT